MSKKNNLDSRIKWFEAHVDGTGRVKGSGKTNTLVTTQYHRPGSQNGKK